MSKGQGRILVPAAVHWDLAWSLQTHPCQHQQLTSYECLAETADHKSVPDRHMEGNQKNEQKNNF
ncbi:hypothetical protein AN396_03570 [Candidatus Epulonipiscium fishelsonii]|uniref:Uncharacterized protein n=1 Tax=Candidatus Epulonipiscium fishelsonii TaxID=77094 RepID=A0ACC8XF17_9FIRM|nr:hypothetical protein AN396_03570 [Epulopiscium sp. SCG-B11WGA-EpuloA1]